MQNMTLFLWALLLFQHWNIGTLVVLHAGVCLCMDFEQEQKFADPYVIHPELKSAVRYPRHADKDHVLAIGLLQFPRHKGPQWETHVTLVLCMPDEKGGVQNNMTLVVVGPMNTQGVQQGQILFSIFWISMQNIKFVCKICSCAKYAKYTITYIVLHIVHILHMRYISHSCTWSGRRMPWTLIQLLSSGIGGKPKEV